jgi:hypothetical protein
MRSRYSFNAGLNIIISCVKFLILNGKLLNNLIPK